MHVQKLLVDDDHSAIIPITLSASYTKQPLFE